MSKTLTEWLAHFEHLHPVSIDMGLGRVSSVWKTLCQQYGIGQLAQHKTFTVAGTNGKGSACKMLALLLSAQGGRVGMYTSPHIHHFRERVQINGGEVDDSQLVRAFEAIEKARNNISLSYFEATTLVGLLIFAWEKVDYAVLEVGLGGRLDAINIIDADAVLITSIGLDHEAYLGSDLSQIALEKAGVCRPEALCVYAENPIYDSVLTFAQQNNIPVLANGRDYHIENGALQWAEHSLTLPVEIARLGSHQMANCAGVLVLLGVMALLPKDYQTPLRHFSLSGRLQRIAQFPDVIVDVAHNEAAARALAQYLHSLRGQYQHCYAVIGMLKDKNHSAVLAPLADFFTQVFFGCTEGERGFSDRQLAIISQAVFDCPMHTCGTLENALEKAKLHAQGDDLIIAFGSFLVVEALTKDSAGIVP